MITDETVIATTDLSQRVKNRLRECLILTVLDLRMTTVSELRRYESFGAKAVAEINDKLPGVIGTIKWEERHRVPRPAAAYDPRVGRVLWWHWNGDGWSGGFLQRGEASTHFTLFDEPFSPPGYDKTPNFPRTE